MIVLRQVMKSYETQVVLDHISCEIEEGCVTALMGKSGRGKTTLLRLLLGLEQPDSGQMEGLAGKRFSAVFQEDRLLPEFIVRENLRCVCRTREQCDRIPYLLRRLGLEAWAGETVEALSGGMQRRVAIARALLAEFDILVLDEPFRGLDEATKQEVIALVLEEAAGRTILVATHDIKEVQWMGGKVLNLDEWR